MRQNDPPIEEEAVTWPEAFAAVGIALAVCLFFWILTREKP